MATNIITKCRQFLLNHEVATYCNSIPVRVAPLIVSRQYWPYSKIPKKFLKPRNRNKRNRDDVYFVADQIPPTHSLSDAVDCLRAYSLFGAEPIDILLKVNMGEKKTRIGTLKGLVYLPKPLVAEQTVLVFAEGEDAEKARMAGASIVGGVELIQQVENNELSFDHCLSTLDFLPNIKHLPKILRNKMPNTRRGTATDDIVSALKIFSHGETYIADNHGRIRQTIARTDFTKDEVHANVKEFLKVIDSHKTVAKDKYFIRAGVVIPAGPQLDLMVEEVAPS